MKADDLDAAFETLPPAWAAVLPGWSAKRRDALIERIREVSADRPIAPDDPFRALRLVAPQEVQVVILGQDPYPKPGQADGLAFSAGQGKPASLRRIFRVLAADRPGFVPPPVWKLDAWARQGVLLLNPTLTIEVGRIGSHMECGWQALTSEIVHHLSARNNPPVFMLWGARAQAFFDAASAPGAVVQALRTRHPSNDMRGDFMREGSQFARTADLVDWWALGGGLAPAAAS